MVFTREQFRDYQRKRAHERLRLARERLGKACAYCGSTEDLDFDHIDASTKIRKVSEATNWSMQRFLAEVDKCQLLCKDCHKVKTAIFGNNTSVEHGGGVKGKANCPCDLCKAKRRDYARERRRRSSNPTPATTPGSETVIGHHSPIVQRQNERLLTV